MAICQAPPQLPPEAANFATLLVTSKGESADADIITLWMDDIIQNDEQTISFGGKDELKAKLKDIYKRCMFDNWDGEDALPISRQSYSTAVEFIDMLPQNVLKPEVAPEVDGDIALEWYSAPNSIFSIGIEGQILNYAGQFGPVKKIRGREAFNGEVPEEISRMLEIFFQKK